MSLGLWTTERGAYDPQTGRLLSNSTWDYWPPMTKDIPEDMRTTFYDSGRNKDLGFMGSKVSKKTPLVLPKSYCNATSLKNMYVYTLRTFYMYYLICSGNW